LSFGKGIAAVDWRKYGQTNPSHATIGLFHIRAIRFALLPITESETAHCAIAVGVLHDWGQVIACGLPDSGRSDRTMTSFAWAQNGNESAMTAVARSS
jgi:hypothetical protein